MRQYLLLMMAVMTCAMTYAANTKKPTVKEAPKKKEKPKAKKEEPAVILDKVIDRKGGYTSLDEFRKNNPPKGPLPQAIGKPLKWLINNADRWDGWSLSGYSHRWITEDYKPARVKIGVIITGSDWADFGAYQSAMKQEAALGVCWTIYF